MQTFLYLFYQADPAQTQSLTPGELWLFLPFGYLLTILIETLVLAVGLPPKLGLRTKLLCGVWLTACTYPIVVLVLPTLFYGFARWQYLSVAEVFAPLAECVLFWIVFRGGDVGLTAADWVRSFAVITAANLASFGIGEMLNYFHWFGLI